MSKETEEALKEIIAMGQYNPSIDVLAAPEVDESQIVEIKDADELPRNSMPLIELTLDDVIDAQPAKPKATPPPTPTNKDHPFGRDEIEVSAYFVERKGDDGNRYKILSAICIQTADMMTSCGAQYDRMIADGKDYKVSLIITNRDDGTTQRYSPINPKAVTAKIREYMQDGSELDSKVIPITRAKGNKGNTAPADAYKPASTA